MTLATPQTSVNVPAAKAAVKSMTGYAEARCEHEGQPLRVNIRSVNHRFLDLRVRVPEGFERFEPAMRQLVRERLRRGHVEVSAHIEAVQEGAVEIHRDIAAAYLGAAEQLRRDFGLKQEPDVVALLRLPGVVATAGAPSARLDEKSIEQWQQQIVHCLGEALERLEEMRRIEGQSLAAEMQALLAGIEEKTAQLEGLIRRSLPAFSQRLKAKLEELVGPGVMEPSRLAQEAAVLAEHADVSEELLRLRSHTGQFVKLLGSAGELGKKLDFLLQEMAREANTLLSKTPGLGEEGLAITELGLQIKGEIEKLREQVQNVE